MLNGQNYFVSLADFCPGIKVQADYSTTKNFTGEIVPGYKAQKALIAIEPAQALLKIQRKANELGFSLKVFDGYRPAKAVKFFQDWALRPEDNPHLKKLFYPGFSRMELFEKGFIAINSSHSRGSAVDLTLFSLSSSLDVDMGSAFDFYDEISHTHSSNVSVDQKANRLLLKQLMESHGFVNFSQEWWHFSFRPEPFPNQAFDFDIE